VESPRYQRLLRLPLCVSDTAQPVLKATVVTVSPVKMGWTGVEGKDMSVQWVCGKGVAPDLMLRRGGGSCGAKWLGQMRQENDDGEKRSCVTGVGGHDIKKNGPSRKSWAKNWNTARSTGAENNA